MSLPFHVAHCLLVRLLAISVAERLDMGIAMTDHGGGYILPCVLISRKSIPGLYPLLIDTFLMMISLPLPSRPDVNLFHDIS